MKNLTFCIFLSILFSCKQQAPTPFEQYLQQTTNQFDILLKNGRIIDGSGSPAFEATILINADTIAFIGQVDTSKIEVKNTIDAKGKIISPGFTKFENFLAMGVTTICLGQDGSSPNEDIGKWMEQINFAKNPSTQQLAKQELLLQQALDAGCFGMSTGLEYTPGIFATDTELLPLAKIVGQNKGLIMSHVRNEDDDQIENSIQELLRQGKYCNVQVSHIKSVYGKGKERAKKLLDLLNNSAGTTTTVTADVYPYNASYTGIGIVFPKWAKAPNDYKKVVKNRRAELLAFLKQKIIDRNGPEATLFGTAPYAGKTLAQLSKEQGLPYEKVLLGIGPNRASGAYFIMDDELQEEMITHPKVMVCSDGSPTMRHPRGYGSFAKIIEEYVLKQKRLSLVEAIRKMTHFPAQTIGLQKRGLIQKGNFADLLIFDPTAIKANATYEKPHQLASGFEYVMVNGQITYSKEDFTTKKTALAGRVLYK